MADRQLFQLTTKAPVLTDVIGIQDAIGAVEQGKMTLQALKDLILTAVPVSLGKRLVIRLDYSIPNYTGVIMENDFFGLTVVSALSSGAASGVNIKVSANIFSTNKTNLITQSIIVDGSNYYIVQAKVVASDTINLIGIHPHTGAYLNIGGNYFINALIYP